MQDFDFNPYRTAACVSAAESPGFWRVRVFFPTDQNTDETVKAGNAKAAAVAIRPKLCQELERRDREVEGEGYSDWHPSTIDVVAQFPGEDPPPERIEIEVEHSPCRNSPKRPASDPSGSAN